MAQARLLDTKDQLVGRDMRNSALELGRAMPRLTAEARRISGAVAAGIHGRRRSGQGDSFWQFRTFTSGESAHRVDWRRSARDDRLYVREREWEAAETLWLWLDRSPSMAFQSDMAKTSKLERGVVLGLALADMLVRGGERVGLLGLGTPTASRRVIETLAEQLVLAASPAQQRPMARAIGLREEAILIGDFIGAVEEITSEWTTISGNGGRAHVVMIADPIEEVFPYAGETEFIDPETGDRLRVGDAALFRQRYVDRLAAHRDALRVAATRLGWTFSLHRTDRPASDVILHLSALLAEGSGLSQTMSGR